MRFLDMVVNLWNFHVHLIMPSFLFLLNFYCQATYYVLPTTEKFYPKCIRSTLKKFNVVGDTNTQMVWFLHFLFCLMFIYTTCTVFLFLLYCWTWHSFLYWQWPYVFNFKYEFRNPVSWFSILLLSSSPLNWLPNRNYLWNWKTKLPLKMPQFFICDCPLALSQFR